MKNCRLFSISFQYPLGFGPSAQASVRNSNPAEQKEVKVRASECFFQFRESLFERLNKGTSEEYQRPSIALLAKNLLTG